MMMETLTAAEEEHSELFCFETIRNYMQLHLSKRINIGYHLWGLVILFLWMKRWNIQSAPSLTFRKTGARSRTISGRQAFLVLGLFAAAVYLGCILSPPSLMDDVDAVQAQIARNMLSSGDWVTARLDGVAYLEKPPLIYWMIAVCYKVFGVHDWVARIPVALSSIALCWLTAAFGAWAFGRRAGFYAGLCMATCVGLWLFTRILIPDVMLTFTIALGMWAFLRVLDPEEQHPRAWAATLAAALGVGLLLKSLIGIVFPIGAAAVYLLCTRQLFSLRVWKRLHPFSGAGHYPAHCRALAYPGNASKSALFLLHNEERSRGIPRLLLVFLLQ